MNPDHSPSFHRLLQRQIKKVKRDDGSLDLDTLLGLVHTTYSELEHNSKTMERAMQLMSEEMRAHHEAIRQEKNRAEHANSAKSEFISVVSHELRTPMHSIMSYTMMGLKQEVVQQSEKLSKYLTNINIASKRILDLLDNLLDLSKMESGKIEYDLSMNNMDEIVHKSLADLDAYIKARNIHINYSTLGEEFFAWCDSRMIRQVLHILIHNACKFSSEHEAVTIAITQDANRFTCSITDNGVGFPQEDSEKVFEKFYDNPRISKDQKGTGISLSICKEVLHAHQGTIEAHRNDATGNTTIIFSLPLKP